MRFAKVVLGLPVDGPFDYLVPEGMLPLALPGSRVKVSFGRLKKCGYIVGLSSASKVRNIKPLLEVIDERPLLTPELLEFTRLVARHCCSSWGEVIETALPPPFRLGKKLDPRELPDSRELNKATAHPGVTLFHSFQRRRRWEFYLNALKETVSA